MYSKLKVRLFYCLFKHKSCTDGFQINICTSTQKLTLGISISVPAKVSDCKRFKLVLVKTNFLHWDNSLWFMSLGTGSWPIWLPRFEYSQENGLLGIRYIFFHSTMGHIFNARCAQHSCTKPRLKRMCFPRWGELAQDEAIFLQQLYHRVSWELYAWDLWMYPILLP